jgi:chloramphenicol-sensitive protein RarD
LLFGLVAYISWGLVPLYFAQVAVIPPAELLAHRIVWSIGIMALLTVLRRGALQAVGRVLVSRRQVMLLTLSAAFLAFNWLLYISATVSHQVTEASMGYYMMPLVNALFAKLFLGERLRPAHYPALALIAGGVIAASWLQGKFTWLAVALPITFGFYGLVRKRMAVDSMTGLTVETIILLGPSLGYLIVQSAQGRGSFGTDWNLSGWLMFSGFVTVIPLLTYTLSIRRLPLITQSFIQFLSPTVQMLIAITLLNETITKPKWVAMVCVWGAVAIFIGDAFFLARHRRRAQGLYTEASIDPGYSDSATTAAPVGRG